MPLVARNRRLSDSAWVVSDVLTCPYPPALLALALLPRVDEWLHPLIVRRVRLDEVHDVKCVLPEPPSVAHFKVVPLRVVVRVRVVSLQVELVLEPIDLKRSPEVSRLEPGLEYQGIIQAVLELIVGLQLLIPLAGLISRCLLSSRV